MFINTKYRSTKTEIMDDFSLEGEMLRKSLNHVAAINKRLGGNKATISGLNTLLKGQLRGLTVSIVDLGCGNGDMLRAVADYGRKNNFTFKLTGIDANKYTVSYARKLSTNYPEISYRKMNVLLDDLSGLNSDIVLATLFIHHFKNEEIESLIKSLTPKINTGFIINDLQRSRTAYYLFKLISIFFLNPMIRKDGLTSVLRGFKKAELSDLSKKLPGTDSTICWKWAFRYQWIIKKHES